MNEEIYKLFDAISQRSRAEIVKLLLDGEPRNIEEIAKKTGLSRTAVSYHLDVLENAGIVEHEYKIIRPPKNPRKGIVGSFYKINREKLKEAIEAVHKLLPIT